MKKSEPKTIKVITKQTLRDIIAVEQRRGYPFSEMVNDAFMAAMPDHVVLPVTHAIPHGAGEMRVMATIWDGSTVVVDMPAAFYEALPTRTIPDQEGYKPKPLQHDAD